jgi:hypothetical protein
MRKLMVFAAAMLVAGSAQAAGWKTVEYWPRIPRYKGCVGFVLKNRDFDGYFTRSKFVFRDGHVMASALHPRSTFGYRTIRAAIDAEKALHWNGCW